MSNEPIKLEAVDTASGEPVTGVTLVSVDSPTPKDGSPKRVGDPCFV